MSKSGEAENGIIWLLDEPSVTAKKIKSAVTDNDRDIRFDPVNKPGVSNLLTLLSVLGGESIPDARDRVRADAATATSSRRPRMPWSPRSRRSVSAPSSCSPTRPSSTACSADAADRAEAIARETLARVYERVGFLPRR